MLLLGRKTSLERVAAFLMEMDRRQTAAGVLALPMCRRDIADYLGLTLETVSRALSQLHGQGILASSARLSGRSCCWTAGGWPNWTFRTKPGSTIHSRPPNQALRDSGDLVPLRAAVNGAVEIRHLQVRKLWTDILAGIGVDSKEAG